MVELIPVMLFILGYDPATPDVIQMERVPMVFADREACEAEGAALLAARRAKDETSVYTFECVTFPERKEFDALFQQLTPEPR